MLNCIREVWNLIKFSVCHQSTVGKDGAVMGVTVTRMSMNLHAQVLSQACSYTEGEQWKALLGFVLKFLMLSSKSLIYIYMFFSEKLTFWYQIFSTFILLECRLQDCFTPSKQHLLTQFSK